MPVKRILTIAPFFPPDIGGLSYHVSNLSINLIKQNIDINIIAPKRIGTNLVESYNNLFKITRLDSIYLPGWPYPSLRSVSIPLDLGLKINQMIKNGNFDILHVHGHHYPISWMAINSARKYGIPSVLTMHGMYALDSKLLGGKSWLEDGFNKLVFAKSLSKTTSVIGLTEQITNYAKKFGPKSINYFTIPNGVSTSVFLENMKRKKEFRQKYQIGQDKKVVLFCARFEKVKGVIEFAKAAKGLIKNSQIEIILVGGGSLESSVKSILHGVDGVHLMNWQPPEKIHELFISSDIFINPSKFEALPLTIIEAMNAGLHIVYTPVGGIPDILKGYSMKTMLKEVSPNEIMTVFTHLTSNFSSYDVENSLSYAHRFDWKDIANDVKNVYLRSIDK